MAYNKKSISVAFFVPEYEHQDYDFEMIKNTINIIFPDQGKNPIKDYNEGRWQITYKIQAPLLTNNSSWKDFFTNMKKLLEATRDYNSHFVNEMEDKHAR